MEKFSSRIAVSALALAALLMVTGAANVSGKNLTNRTLGSGTDSAANKLLPIGKPSTEPLRVPDIFAPSTKEVSLVSLQPEGVVNDAPVDLNGDGKTDYVVTRNTGGGTNGQLTWYFNFNSAAGNGAINWGLASDWVMTEDFDGDNKDDITIWRPGPPSVAAFYILQSQSNTLRVVQFGQNGDIPTIVADYDGDGRADPAIFRIGSPSTWYYLGSLNNPSNNLTVVGWGSGNDVPAPGDFNGDGHNDFGIYRDSGTGQLQFWRLLSTGAMMPVVNFGILADIFAPGDYDGDHKTDLATFRRSSGQTLWSWMSSIDGSVHSVAWGSQTDFPVQGDYDGDGKTDVAIWRPDAVGGQATFWVDNSSTGSVTIFPWGLNGDFPVASYNVY